MLHLNVTSSYQFFGKIWIVFQSSPELLDHLLEDMKIRIWFELVQHGGVPEDGIVEARNAIHIHVVLSSRDGGQVDENLQLIDV